MMKEYPSSLWIDYFKEYIRADIHQAKIKELEAQLEKANEVLAWYECTVKQFATSTDQRADDAEEALDKDRGFKARTTVAKLKGATR